MRRPQVKPSKFLLTLGLALGLTSAAIAQQITMRNAISVAQNSPRTSTRALWVVSAR